jgi:hypothetical protein
MGPDSYRRLLVDARMTVIIHHLSFTLGRRQDARYTSSQVARAKSPGMSLVAPPRNQV